MRKSEALNILMRGGPIYDDAAAVISRVMQDHGMGTLESHIDKHGKDWRQSLFRPLQHIAGGYYKAERDLRNATMLKKTHNEIDEMVWHALRANKEFAERARRSIGQKYRRMCEGLVDALHPVS